MTKKDHNKWVKLLTPYWKKREEAYSVFMKNERGIELLMNKELKPPVELEFFYGDMGCCGIGAFEDIDKFQLIHDSDLISAKYKLNKNGDNKWVF